MESKQIVDAFQTMMFNDFKYKWLDCITSDSSRLDHSGGNKLRFCRTFKDANIGEHYFKYKILTRNEKRTLDKCIKIKRKKNRALSFNSIRSKDLNCKTAVKDENHVY